MNIVEEKVFGPVCGYRFGFSPMGPPMMSVYMYLVDGILIDTAQSRMRRHVLDVLDGRRVRQVLLTHHHEDHSGNAAAVSRRFRVPVIGHALTREKLARPFAILPYQHLVWGKTEPVEVVPCPETIQTAALRFLPIHTPGHSKDHTVYLEENNGWLFSGDLYLGDRIKFFRSDERIFDQIASIRRVLAYDFSALFCGHNPNGEDGSERLRRKLQFLEDFLGSVQRLVAKGYSEKAIVRILDRRVDRKVKWITMGNASAANMIRTAVREIRQKG